MGQNQLKTEFQGEYYNGKPWNGTLKEYRGRNLHLTFEGKLINGQKNGIEKKYGEHHLLEFEGEYKDGKIIKGKEYYHGLLEFEGEYLDEKRNGPGKEYYYNGELKFVGKYLNGKRNGLGKEYHQNGKLRFEVEYLNGEINGKIKEYYDNGVLKFDRWIFEWKIIWKS